MWQRVDLTHKLEARWKASTTSSSKTRSLDLVYEPVMPFQYYLFCRQTSSHFSNRFHSARTGSEISYPDLSGRYIAVEEVCHLAR
jgi:hypothetical protein